tara:strand:- start:437 stop:964 length:528 start_codon:yes stop_codon:yes gene_type:complete
MGVNFTGGAAFTGGSSGFLSDAPIGSIIQIKYFNQNSKISTTSTSNLQILEGDITMKGVNSQVLVWGHITNFSSANSTGAWTNATYFKLQYKAAGGSYSRVAQMEHPGPQNDVGEFAQCIPVSYYSGTFTQGTQYYFEYAVKPVSSGDTHYYGRDTDSSAQNVSGARMILLEIAQ